MGKVRVFREGNALLMKVGVIMMALVLALVIPAPAPFGKGGRQSHFGSEGDDLSLRIKKLLHRNAQEVPGAAGGSSTRTLAISSAKRLRRSLRALSSLVV
jgi:hypothetical protein